MDDSKNVEFQCQAENKWDVTELEVVIVSVLLASYSFAVALPAAVKLNVIVRVFPDVHCSEKDRSGGVRSAVDSQDWERLLQRYQIKRMKRKELLSETM